MRIFPVQVTTDSEIWRQYARLLMENPDATDMEKERVRLT